MSGFMDSQKKGMHCPHNLHTIINKDMIYCHNEMARILFFIYVSKFTYIVCGKIVMGGGGITDLDLHVYKKKQD